jgi:hypothetical protein
MRQAIPKTNPILNNIFLGSWMLNSLHKLETIQIINNVESKIGVITNQLLKTEVNNK